jgi:hypothetical protein
MVERSDVSRRTFAAEAFRSWKFIRQQLSFSASG